MIDLELNKSLFLLFLVVCGNYIGELLGCKTQKLLSENMYMKHIVLFFIIVGDRYFINNNLLLTKMERSQGGNQKNNASNNNYLFH